MTIFWAWLKATEIVINGEQYSLLRSIALSTCHISYMKTSNTSANIKHPRVTFNISKSIKEIYMYLNRLKTQRFVHSWIQQKNFVLVLRSPFTLQLVEAFHSMSTWWQLSHINETYGTCCALGRKVKAVGQIEVNLEWDFWASSVRNIYLFVYLLLIFCSKP